MVRFSMRLLHPLLNTRPNITDIITLDILRGIQGMGAAATIPASVRHFFLFSVAKRLRYHLRLSLASSLMRSPRLVLGR